MFGGLVCRLNELALNRQLGYWNDDTLAHGGGRFFFFFFFFFGSIDSHTWFPPSCQRVVHSLNDATDNKTRLGI